MLIEISEWQEDGEFHICRINVDDYPIYEIQIASLEDMGKPGLWQLSLATDDEGGSIDLEPVEGERPRQARDASVAQALRQLADVTDGTNGDIEEFEQLKAEGRIDPKQQWLAHKDSRLLSGL